MGVPPLILALSPSDSNLQLLARMTCYGCVSLQSVPDKLGPMIRRALSESPRHLAAGAILRMLEAHPVVEAIVREILLADQPVRDEADLAARLARSEGTLRKRWKAAAPDSTLMKLYTFIRWGRLLRSLELARRHVDVVEVAVTIGVDEATIYRDSRELLGAAFGDAAQYGAVRAARGLVNAIGRISYVETD